MPKYMISLYQPDGPIPAPEVLERVGRELHLLNERIKSAGGWVFTGGLHAPSTATVVRVRDGRVVETSKSALAGVSEVN